MWSSGHSPTFDVDHWEPSLKKNLIRIGIVIVGAGLWAWYDLTTKPANERVQAGVQQILKKEPSLQPMYDAAMSDGVLTTSEARKIVNKAVELKRD